MKCMTLTLYTCAAARDTFCGHRKQENRLFFSRIRPPLVTFQSWYRLRKNSKASLATFLLNGQPFTRSPGCYFPCFRRRSFPVPRYLATELYLPCFAAFVLTAHYFWGTSIHMNQTQLSK